MPLLLSLVWCFLIQSDLIQSICCVITYASSNNSTGLLVVELVLLLALAAVVVVVVAVAVIVIVIVIVVVVVVIVIVIVITAAVECLNRDDDTKTNGAPSPLSEVQVA